MLWLTFSCIINMEYGSKTGIQREWPDPPAIGLCNSYVGGTASGLTFPGRHSNSTQRVHTMTDVYGITEEPQNPLHIHS